MALRYTRASLLARCDQSDTNRSKNVESQRRKKQADWDALFAAYQQTGLPVAAETVKRVQRAVKSGRVQPDDLRGLSTTAYYRNEAANAGLWTGGDRPADVTPDERIDPNAKMVRDALRCVDAEDFSQSDMQSLGIADAVRGLAAVSA